MYNVVKWAPLSLCVRARALRLCVRVSHTFLLHVHVATINTVTSFAAITHAHAPFRVPIRPVRYLQATATAHVICSAHCESSAREFRKRMPCARLRCKCRSVYCLIVVRHAQRRAMLSCMRCMRHAAKDRAATIATKRHSSARRPLAFPAS